MNKNVLVIGAGRSGRGYLGELLSLEHWNVTFADIDQMLIDQLNARKHYHVFKYDEDEKETVTEVSGYEALHTLRDHDRYIDTLSNADLVMTALFPDAFEQVARDIVEAMRKRMKDQRKDRMIVLLGANYVGLKACYTELIQTQLSKEETDYFDRCVHLVESVITRINSMPTDCQRAFDPLSIQGQDQNILAVNEEILNDRSKADLPQFFVYEKDTQKHFKTKIWQGNTLHCTLAFMGAFKGYTYIFEAARDPYLYRCAQATYREANAGLAALYGENVRVKGPIPFLEELKDDAVKDWIKRVGGDPQRKLSKNDRFIGPALLCAKNGILPYFICKGAAYGFYFNESDDRIAQMIKQYGIGNTVQRVCGLDLQQAEEKLVYDLIVNACYEIDGRKEER